jgi:hypothetical protein
VKGTPVLEKIFMIHGAIHFRIAPNPKRGGASQLFPLEKGRGRNTYKNNKISVLKCFS